MNRTDSNWLTKYQPKQMCDIVGNGENIKLINDYFKQYDNPENIIKPTLLIIGTNGVGKTLSIDLALKAYGYEKMQVNFSDINIIKTKKTTKNKNISGKNTTQPVRKININLNDDNPNVFASDTKSSTGYKKRGNKIVDKKTTNTQTDESFYQSLQSSKKFNKYGQFVESKCALVIDDMSHIYNVKEKNVIKCLIRLNNKYKKFPIVLIAGICHKKFINEIRKIVSYGKKENKKTNELVFEPPHLEETTKFMKHISQQEKLNIRKKDESDIFYKIYEQSQQDVRKIISMMYDLKLMYDEKEINVIDIDSYCIVSKKKDMDEGIYEANKKLLNKYNGIDESLIIYSEQRITIPLMVHENYATNISYQYPKLSQSNKLQMLSDITRSICISDKIDGMIHSNQYWSLQTTHGFYSCVVPSYILNEHPGKLNKKEDKVFTKDYNKTSKRRINLKTIKQAKNNPKLKNMSVTDLLHFSVMLKTLILDKKFMELVQVVQPYNMSLKDILTIIKIDKIDAVVEKKLLNKKEKKLLENWIKNDANSDSDNSANSDDSESNDI